MLLTCTTVGCDDSGAPDELIPQPEHTTVLEAGGLTLHRSTATGIGLNGINLNGINLNGVNLNGINLNGINLNGINLNGVGLNGINLNGINLNGINLNGINLNGINLNGINLNGINLNGINLNGINLNGVTLSQIGLNALRLNGIVFNGLHFDALNVDGLALDGIRLNGLALDGMKLNGINESGIPLDQTQVDNFKLALSYLTKCALSSAQSVTIYDVDDSEFTLSGQHGLDTTWDTNMAASVAHEADVTECFIEEATHDSAHPANTVSHSNQERLVVRDFFNHVVSCALPASTCVTITDTDGVSTYQACGLEGLDPSWQIGPANPAVSAQVAACVTEQATDHGDDWFDMRDRFKTILKYSIQCALRSDQSITATDWDGSSLTWQGSLGLADWWSTSALAPAPSPKPATAGEQLVSACLMARSNAKGNSVMLSLRARPELAPSGSEATDYARHEGAFMGNLFSTSSVAKSCSAAGGGWLRDPVTGATANAGRVCAEGTECGFTYVGSCTSLCTIKPGVGGETMFDECAGNSFVVNTFLFSGTGYNANTGTRTSQSVAGSGAPMIAAADFNLDGTTDLAFETNNTSIKVRLNKGDGTYGLDATYNLGAITGVKALIAKDLDANGIVDLVTANQSSLSVLMGNGDGTFVSPLTISVTNASGSLASVVAGDFNGDGDVDLATNLTSGVGVFLGNGNGTFGSQTSYGTGAGRSITAGDFNGDNKLDLATAASSAATVYVYGGNGNGTFNAATSISVGAVGGLARQLTTGDFNGDGRADLAVAVSGSSDNKVKVLLGTATAGSFTSQTISLSGSGDAVAVSAAYLNADAHMDLVAVRGQNAILLTGSSSGTFTAGSSYSLAENTSFVVAGHFDGDPLWRTDLYASGDAGTLVRLPGAQ